MAEDLDSIIDKGGGMTRPNEFSRATQWQALSRQKNRCASCGVRISALGDEGREEHPYGEGAQAHHARHIKSMGSDSVDNCVILCQSCHYSAHEGGNCRFGTAMVRGEEYPHFRG